jgi:hypothetical protein
VTARLLLTLVAVLCACRSDRRPRDASRAVVAPSATVTPDASVERRARYETTDLTAWTDAGPGVRWRSATVHIMGFSPVVERASPPPAVLSWAVVRLDVARVRVSVERTPDEAIGALWRRDRTVLALVDGGYFEPDHSASGLVFSGGAALAPVGLRGGSGVLRVTSDRVDVVPIDVRDGGTFAPSSDVMLALQCGPRVIEAGGACGIHRHDGRYAARTVACVRDEGRTLDLIAVWDRDEPRRGPELHDLATLLAGPSPVGDSVGCEVALNLDGGPSTGVYARASQGTGALEHEPVGPTPWGLVVRARR